MTDRQRLRVLSASAATMSEAPAPAAFAARANHFASGAAVHPQASSPASSAIDPAEFARFLEHAAGLLEGETRSLRSWLDLAEAWQITLVLRRCRGNRSATARELGIGRRTLYAKMEKLGITASWGV